MSTLRPPLGGPPESREYDAQPWDFMIGAGPEERGIQAAHQARLQQRLSLQLGNNCYLSPRAHIFARELVLGNQSWVAAGVHFVGQVRTGVHCGFEMNSAALGVVTLGSFVRIEAGARLIGGAFKEERLDQPLADQGLRPQPIAIGDDVLIGANAVVLGGVRIGSHVIVLPGAVVSEDVPDFAVVAGNPARFLRDRRAASGGGQRDGLAGAMAAGLPERLAVLSQTMAEAWPAILARHRTGSGPCLHADPAGPRGSAYRPDCDAIAIAAMFDAVPEPLDAAAWSARLGAWQDPASGLCPEPAGAGAPAPASTPDEATLSSLMGIGYALECLGAALPHPVAHFAGLAGPALRAALDGQAWQHRASAAGLFVDAFASAVYFEAAASGDAGPVEGLVGWLTTRADPASGLWGRAGQHQDWLEPINGFYHIGRGVYGQFGLPLPYPERAIDTTCGHVKRNSFFQRNRFDARNLLAAIHGFALPGRQTRHREEEVRELVTVLLNRALEHYQPGLGFGFAAGEPPSLAGTEMWLSVVGLAARFLGYDQSLGFSLVGMRRDEAALALSVTPQRG